MDNKMGDDSAMECVRNENGRISLFTSWTYSKVEPYVSRSDSPQDIVQLQESSIIDGKLYCKFKRDVVSVVKGNTFDLASNKYNLMVVSGDSMKGKFRISDSYKKDYLEKINRITLFCTPVPIFQAPNCPERL